MNHNRQHFGCSSVKSDESSQQLIIKNAFDRLYERSPLPELLQSHLGNSPKKRFHGTGNATPSDRFNQIYASLKKTRKTDTSLSHSDHSASFSHNNSFSKDYVHDSPHLNRSSDSVFRSPVRHWDDRDTSFSRGAENKKNPNQNRNNNYNSEFSLRLDNEKNVRHNIEVYGESRDKFVGESTQGVNSQVSFRDDDFREDFECDSENREIVERGANFKHRNHQYRKERDTQISGRYRKENVNRTGMSGCQWDKSDSHRDIQNFDMLTGNQEDNQLVSPVIPIQGRGRKPLCTKGPVMSDQTHSRYEILRSKERSCREERSINKGREATVDYNSESDFEREYGNPGCDRAESDGSISDIDLIQSDNEDIHPHPTDHNSQGHEGNHELQSISHQEDTRVHHGSVSMADQDAEKVLLDQPSEAAIGKRSLGKKGKCDSDRDNRSDNRGESERWHHLQQRTPQNIIKWRIH
ncbi:uncharacterized protein LOC117324103 isoform X2 [Pecten maximus]|uniref:uncharacterized protein LOC117324103 isoform X2 n=1 Tax=Pecten maximus TaxID=6579 RepID=UPI0014581704|nr:uncharacterized protein LOC117324103 isoform X2 [Pecten maximus]